MNWKHPVFVWSGITLVIIVIGFSIPDSWFQSVQGVYSVEEKATPFSPVIEDFEKEFDGAESYPVTVEEHQTLSALLIRKLLHRAKLNEREMSDAEAIILDALGRAQQTPEHVETIGEHAAKRLIEVLPRMKPEDIKTVTHAFFRKLKPGGGPTSDKACGTCHQQMQLLPDGATFDSSGIYPGADQTVFRDGRAFPVMNEFLDVQQSAKLLGKEATPKQNCSDCHAPHGKKGHDVTLKHRRDNLGFWVNLDADPIPGMLDIEVKLKSFESAHRVPGGKPNRAYVITVDAFDSEQEPLTLWWGSRLPPALSKAERPGLVFAKKMLGERGDITSDVKRAVRFIEDERLEHGRFSGNHFVYVSDGPARVVAKLHYLPKYPAWDGSEIVLELEKTR